MSNVVSVIALVVSIGTAAYATIAARRISHREVTTTVIADYYASMRALTQLQLDEWRLAHLFEVVHNYEHVARQLDEIAPAADDPLRVELRLKERAGALTIFGLYEYVIYQLSEADAAKDKVRQKFLTDAADYFTDRLLTNPRLRYLWDATGGNLECEFEHETRRHFRENVKLPLEQWDSTGPYG